jgi:hypothetical protein
METVAAPLLNVAAPEVYEPLESTTEPVAVGVPAPALTATATLIESTTLMLVAEGVNLTVGIARVIVTVVVPAALL